MTENQGPEDQLTRTLTAQAQAYVEHGGAPVELTSVLARAGEIRRGRRLRASLVMAAVVLATAGTIGVTTLARGGSTTPVPPIADSPSTSPSPTAPADGLARIPLGPRLDHSYFELGVLHNSDGSTRQLPFSASNGLTAITPYLGGYLVANDRQAGNVSLYDGSGKVVASGPGSSRFVTTSDGVETAYTMNGRLYSNPGSGMASGDGAIGRIASGGWPLGYLQSGLLLRTGSVAAGGTPQLELVGGGQVPSAIQALSEITAADDVNDVAAGITVTGEGQVVSAKTDRPLWSSVTWVPDAFDGVGKYVAASDTVRHGTRGQMSDGYATKIAILDVSSGHVIASADLAGKGLRVVGSPVFDDSENLIAVVRQTNGVEAILRLSPTTGRLDRATRLVDDHLGTQPYHETQLVIPVGPQ
ncbi:MAG: hypothetical protein JWQ32_2563 [Marmoricola sp.]|nr:hypothetical protein [Marmoricola sp.]